MIAAISVPLIFLGNTSLAILGIFVWGVGIGAQSSILRAVVAKLFTQLPKGKTFGVFNANYGICWFLGSALMGYFYERDLTLLIAFSMVSQFLAFALFFYLGLFFKRFDS